MISLSVVSGQHIIPHKGNLGGIANFKVFTADDGLALSSIASSYVDHLGNIWFGTYGAGVSRYDGNSFTNFNIANGLAGNVILSIYQDKSNTIWFGTNRKGLSKFDGKTFTNYTTEDGLPDNTILSITSDREGNIWLGTYGGGVSKYDGTKFTNYSTDDGLPDNNVRAILTSKNGGIWFGTLQGGLSHYDGEKFRNYSTDDGLLSNKIFNIIETREGHLWIGTIDGGISYYNGKSFTNYLFAGGKKPNQIWCSFEDISGDLWFGTRGGGVLRFDGEQFSVFTETEGLPNNFVYSICEDKNKNLWFSTFGGGVCRYEGETITNFTVNQGLSSNIVYSILQDRRGNYYFGTYGGGLNISYSNNSKHSFKFTLLNSSNGLTSNDIKSLYEDSKGNIWIGTIGGGASMMPEGKKNQIVHFSSKDGLPDDRINCIIEDSNGIIWFATAGGGVGRYDGTSFKTLSVDYGLAGNIVCDIIQDRTGNLWFATTFGVSRYDGNEFKSFTTKDGLSSNSVYKIFEDDKGNFWFGTDGKGVSYFDGASFRNFNVTDGMSDNTVGQIIGDQSGKIFFATNAGITTLTGWENEKPIFEIYNKRTGYNISDVNSGQQGMYIDRDGIIWIATGDNNSALVRFDYNTIRKNNAAPSVFIKNVKINEKNINWFRSSEEMLFADSTELKKIETAAFGQESIFQNAIKYEVLTNTQFDGFEQYYPVPTNLVLPIKYHHITFEYITIETAKPSLVNYKYTLEGYDNGWSPITKKTSAVFGNITEGTYTFKLMAQSPDGIWSESLTYTFKILPPWYRSIYAYIFYLLAFVFSVSVLIKLYSRRLIKINTQLEKVIKKRTSEIAERNEELLKQTEKIQLQSESLKDANAAKDKFFKIIAHDLRSPISGVMKLTDLMANQSEDLSIDEYVEISKMLNQSTGNLYILMDNLLEWAKTQSEGIIIEYKNCNIQSLVSESIKPLEETAARKKITVENRVNTLFMVKLDEKMINSVIRNLLSNAVKFTNLGGKIIIDAVQTNGEIKVSICDNGIGIADEDIQKIFKLDEKKGRKGTDNESSTGLGLVLCKEFVSKHGGRIWAESRENVGSTFYFTIPINNDE